MRLRQVARLYHTVRHLRREQIVGRIRQYLLRYLVPSSRDLPTRRQKPVRGLVEGRRRPPSMIGPNEFIFLNRAGRLKSAADWNDPKREKLWLYNLHYFDDLNAVGAETRRQWHRDLINRWVQENPPGVGNGWEPYPVSLRVVNWIKWDLREGLLSDAAVQSLSLQLRWLRQRLEYHLLGNHLLANAKALIFGGLYFEGLEANEWFSTGWRVFNEQITEQVLPDGGHFELSPMYHLIVLEDVLDVLNVCHAYGVSVPEHWKTSARRMLNWASVMRHPDGDIPFFNDAAFGVAGTFEELADYANRLFGYERPCEPGSVYLADSGYIRLMKGDAVVFFDAAALGPDYLPGHGHADTLAVEVSLFGQRVMVNSGTSVYSAGPERDWQRGTSAHNTVMIDGENSSEVWGGFRVARRAKPRTVEFNPAEGLAAAEHDGYGRLIGRPVHRRRVRLGVNELTVTDILTTFEALDRVRDIVGTWHFHPSIQVRPVEPSEKEGAAQYILEIPCSTGSRRALMILHGPCVARLERSTWHPEFGRSIPTTRLVFSYKGRLPVEITTNLVW